MSENNATNEQKKERTIDDFQKQAINARKNSVVSAGAGSGKTTVLAERFLSLVNSNEKINADEILTLTFTKKATVEMSSRIYSVLKAKSPEQAKLFYKASIKTFDSYCTSVARTGSHYYGVSPEFTQDKDKIISFMKSRALPFILKNRDNEAIKALVSTKDYGQMAEELFIKPILEASTIAQPIDFNEALNNQIDEVVAKAEKEITETNRLISSLYSAEKAYDGNMTATFKAFQENLSTEIPSIKKITREEVLDGDYRKLLQYVLAVSKITQKLPSGKGCDEIKEWCKKIRAHVPSNLATDSSDLASIVNFIAGIRYIKLLIPLLEDFQNQVNDFKRSSGFLTFSDISNMALNILKDHPEIRQVEKEKFKAIMIDEFQDNNSLQRDILFLLAENLNRKEKSIPRADELCPQKLFFVGDEKQSIYIFRGADVSVFRSLSKDFADGNLSMNINYRSHPALIAGFNTIFGGIPYPLENLSDSNGTNPPSVFYTEDDEKNPDKNVPDYEAVYHEVYLPKEKAELASKKENIPELFAPHIHIALYDSEGESDDQKKYLSNKESEAEWVAKKIEELTTKGIHGKIYTHKDIAILFKTYTPQNLFEKTFLSHGIPYNTEVVKGFFSDGPVNDIYSLLTLCLYENDTLSYAEVLHSPFVNLSFSEMNAVIIRNEKPFELSDESILSPESLDSFYAARDLYLSLKNDAKISSITKLISKIWYEAGYRYETLWNKKVQMYAKDYDLLFELARKAEESSLSLAEFLDEISAYKDSAEKLEDINIPIEQDEGVHLLSIHKSKGLEYPVVFLCNSNSSSRKDSNSSLVYCSKNFGITLNTPPLDEMGKKSKNYFYIKASSEEAKKLSAESRRLLYVALTRAKDELFITNNNYVQDEDALEKFAPGGTNNADSLFDILEPCVNFYLQDENKAFSPFDFEKIPQAEREYKSENAERANTQSQKISLISQIKDAGLYENAQKIEKESLESKYILPSKVYAEENFIAKKHQDEAIKEYDIIDEIINSTRIAVDDASVPSAQGEARFSHANFGTVAHAYLESSITGLPPKYSNSVISGLETKAQVKTVESICQKMKEQFENSELGKKARKSVWHKAEYGFKSQSADGSGKIIKGTIDLVFKNDDGNYTIVDYKSGANMNPENYYAQLSCYRHAVSQMLGIKNPDEIKCVLYYLRFGKEVVIPNEAL